METKWQMGPKQIRWHQEKYEGRGFSVSELVEEERTEYIQVFYYKYSMTPSTAVNIYAEMVDKIEMFTVVGNIRLLC